MTRIKLTITAVATLLFATVLAAFALAGPSGAAVPGTPYPDPTTTPATPTVTPPTTPPVSPSPTAAKTGVVRVPNDPAPGKSSSAFGSNATPGGQVVLDLIISDESTAGFVGAHYRAAAAGQTYRLGQTTADASGNWSIAYTLPEGVTGTGTLVATDVTTGRVLASNTVTLGSADTNDGSATPVAAAGDGGSGGDGGVTASTGVAVLSIGGVGVALLLGGSVMLLSARRRRGSHA